MTDSKIALPVLKDERTWKKLTINLKRNKQNDKTEDLITAGEKFDYSENKNQYWNPAEFSFLWGTPLWEQSTEDQRLKLNHIYWLAYYSQIISAEIATIYLNQCAAAGMYAVNDFKLVCDNLDVESAQERAHVECFQKVISNTEEYLFGERVFGRPMSPYYLETMIYQNTSRIKSFYKRLQLQAFSLLSSSSAFIGSQYFTVRGIRTLCGKMVQHILSDFYAKSADQDSIPLPAQISYFHFIDESHHFNSSRIIAQDVVKSLKEPTAFEKMITNQLVYACQKDHFYFSAAINGIFWYDPALYKTVYKVLRSPVFSMGEQEALEMIRKCFTVENDALHSSYATHRKAAQSYRSFVTDMPYISAKNIEMNFMMSNSVENQLKINKRCLNKFRRTL